MGMKKTISKEILEEIVQRSLSFADVQNELNIRGGTNLKRLKSAIKAYQINTDHFESMRMRYQRIYGEYPTYDRKTPTKEILTENSTFSRCHLKKRLYREGLKTKLCEICGQDEDWHGKHMSLILDHINGVYNDNRLENLRIVCPNCNATLDTHCGKNVKKKETDILLPREKEVKIQEPKPPYVPAQKIVWPSNEELEKLIWSTSLRKLADTLGVTDNAIKRHCISRGIPRPPQGHWAKKR